MAAYQPFTITEVSGTPNVNIVSPTGLATSAHQASQTTVLSSIDSTLAAINSKTPILGQALAASSTPVVLPAAQVADLKVTSATVVSSALPTGAATSAKQDSQTTLLTSIESSNADINLSIATPGSAVPSKSSQASGSDGTNARILKTDASGELQVDVVNTVSVSTGTVAITAASLPTHGVTQAGTWNAPSGTTTVSGSVSQNGSWSVSIAGTPTVSTTGTIPVSFPSVPVVSAGTVAITAASLPTHGVTQAGTWNAPSGTTVVSSTGTVITQLLPSAVSANGLTNSNSQNIPKVSVKSSAGRLYGGCFFSNRSTTQYILIFDSASQPAANTAPTLAPLPMSPGQTACLEFGVYGMVFSNGIYIANSTSATAYVNGTSDTWINVRYQ